MVTGWAWLLAWGLAAAPPCVRSPLPQSMRGATVVHLDDLADADPSNDGKRGYGTPASRATLKQLKAVGLDLVSLVTVANMASKKDSSIRTNFSTRGHATGANLVKTMREAHEMGLRVMVVPHIQLTDGSWRGDITLPDRVLADAFFSSLTAYVTHVAELAEAGCADIMSISLELKGLSGRPEHRAHFLSLIAAVRHEFKGTVTYSANWDEASSVVFWDSLDLVGINGFWPLQQKAGASVEELRSGAQQVARELTALHARTRKRILLTEFGFKSVKDSALRPWEWPQTTTADDLPSDEAYQASAYEALLCALQPHPWNAGAVAWVVPSDLQDAASANRWEGPNGFNPLNKQAQAVLAGKCR